MSADKLDEVRAALRLASRALAMMADGLLFPHLADKEVKDVIADLLKPEPKPRTPSKNAKYKARFKQIRCTAKDARTMLGCSASHLLDISCRDVFTQIYTDEEGRGRGKRVYYIVDEIEMYALTGSEWAVKAYRKKRGRLR